jgi:hypothetical protein
MLTILLFTTCLCFPRIGVKVKLLVKTGWNIFRNIISIHSYPKVFNKFYSGKSNEIRQANINAFQDLSKVIDKKQIELYMWIKPTRREYTLRKLQIK